MSGNNEQPIVIKKVKKVVGGGHHGGAWKVAYADFVTAMMAFFLLMWLVNTTSPEQKRGIADYFAPASVSKSAQGSDGLLGGTAFEDEGARSSGASRPMPEVKSKSRQRARRERGGGGPGSGPNGQSAVSEQAMQQAIANRERAEFTRAEQSLRQAMLDLPDLAELSRHLIVDQTPEGLRIQLVDQEGRAMFEKGAARPLERTRTLLKAVAKIIEKLPNRISLSGHTGSQASGQAGYSNWELSSDRANAARRFLEEQGTASDRIYQVSGKAGSEPLYPDDPNLPGNRRISIVLLREAPVLPDNHSLGRR